MKIASVHTLRLVFVVVNLSFIAGITEAEEALTTSATSAQASQGSRLIAFADDRLTVKVEGIPISEVLEEVARQSGFRLLRFGSLEDPITLEFYRLPLGEGLRRILRQQNFAVEYAQPTGKERSSILPQPKTVWIVSKAEQDHLAQPLVVEGSKAQSLGDDRALDVWQAALKSDDVSDREEAVTALGESGRPDVVPFLQFALQDKDADVREAAIVALVELGGGDAVRALTLALRDENASIREEVVEAFEEIGGAEAVEALALTLQDEDTSVREKAVEALGNIGGEHAIYLLGQVLGDEDESVREAAADALAQLGH